MDSSNYHIGEDKETQVSIKRIDYCPKCESILFGMECPKCHTRYVKTQEDQYRIKKEGVEKTNIVKEYNQN